MQKVRDHERLKETKEEEEEEEKREKKVEMRDRNYFLSCEKERGRGLDTAAKEYKKKEAEKK